MNLFLIIFSLLLSKHPAKKDTISTTAIVDGVFYKAVVNNDQSVSIKLNSGKEVFHIDSKDLDSEEFAKLEFSDFNGDGYKDLLIRYRSNVPDISDLILFNKNTRRFVKVKDFEDYPDPKRIPNTSLYYSYHRSGCSDNNWDSDLFKIIDFHVVKLGNISANACDDEAPKGIFIYKINRSSEKLIKKLSIQAPDGYNDTKWGFIAHYWKSNYKKFIKSN